MRPLPSSSESKLATNWTAVRLLKYVHVSKKNGFLKENGTDTSTVRTRQAVKFFRPPASQGTYMHMYNKFLFEPLEKVACDPKNHRVLLWSLNWIKLEMRNISTGLTFVDLSPLGWRLTVPNFEVLQSNPSWSISSFWLQQIQIYTKIDTEPLITHRWSHPPIVMG